MKSRPKQSPLKLETDQKIHYKMFKDGKKWAFAGVVTTFFTVLPFVQTNVVQADSTDEQGPTAYTSGAQSAASAATAVLETRPAAATATAVAEAPAKAQLEITNTQATTASTGVVTVTGTTAANATVTATTADGNTQTTTADANGQFSIALTATNNVILKASLDGVTSEPAAVVVPKAEAAADDAQKTATAAAATADKSANDATTEAQQSNQTPAVATEKTTAAKSTTVTGAQSAAATPAATDQAAVTSSKGNTTTLVDPSAAELADAKAAATAAYEQTGAPQTLQALAAGSVAPSVFKTTDLTVETVDDKGETADKALPSGDFTGESKAEATFTVKGIDPSSDLAGDHVYVNVLVPKGINVTDANGDGQLNFTIDPYATLVAVINYESASKPETVRDLKAHVEEFVNESGDTQLREGLNQKFTVQTPFSIPATLSKVDNGTMITVDLAEVPNLTTDLEKAFQGGLNTIISSWSRVPLIGPFAGPAAHFALGWWVGGDVAADPAKFLSSVIEKGILTDMSATVKSTLTVDKGTHVVTGDDPQPVTIKGAITTTKTADDLGTGAGTNKLYYVDQTDASGTSTGTDDPGDTTPTTDGFPVTYKYLDENGTEIPNSAQTTTVAKDGDIDFNPLNPPSGYTFDPAQTIIDVNSTVFDAIKSTFSDAKDFASLDKSLAGLLSKPSQYIDYGNEELTITYKGTKVATTHKVTISLVDANGDPVKNTDGVSTIAVGRNPLSTGTTVTTSGYNYKVTGYTMRPNSATSKYIVTSTAGDQVITVVYDKDKSTTGGGTDTPATAGTITVKLVDINGNPVTNVAGKSTLPFSEGTIGDLIPITDEDKTVTDRQITDGGDGTDGVKFTADPQTVKITYTNKTSGSTVDDNTITVNLVDTQGNPVKNTDGQSSYTFAGKNGSANSTSTVNKTVDGYHIIKDDLPQSVTNSDVAQTFTIVYDKDEDGPRVYTPDNPGKTTGDNPDPVSVTSRYLIATVQADVVYTGEGAPAKKTGTPIKIYRTATLDANRNPVYTPWTPNSNGVAGNGNPVLLAPITESDIPPVTNAVGTIVDETNKPITPADLPDVGKTSTASDGKTTLIDGTANTVDKDLGKFVTNFIATRVVNYGANQPDLQWHDAPKDPTDPLYNDTHKVLHPIMMMIKDGVTTKQDDNEDEVVLTRQYQIDNNDPDSGVKAYGPWIVDKTGTFMTVGYTPVIYDGYKASPAEIDQDTQDDDHKTVTEELAAMAAETADQDKKITFTINYDKEKAELVEHPAPNEPRDVNYDDTHKS
ncbi:KxYKxGKxW signal peptide domain-containing protein [Lacticaseibacillus jixiensis]|uniref:KxYKxGKxW signal peptide domain-containing protein n=1 Tax=Lacticaseibacillus jixiensis TaxID=3231926 RepID=UPI0036F3440E